MATPESLLRHASDNVPVHRKAASHTRKLTAYMCLSSCAGLANTACYRDKVHTKTALEAA